MVRCGIAIPQATGTVWVMDNYWKARCVKGGCGLPLCNSLNTLHGAQWLAPWNVWPWRCVHSGPQMKTSLVDELLVSITTTKRKQSTSNLLLSWVFFSDMSSIFIFGPNIIYIEINKWVRISLTSTKLSTLFFSTMSLCLSLVPMEVKGNLPFWLGHALPNSCVLPRSCAHTSSTSSRDSRVICIASEVGCWLISAYLNKLDQVAGTSTDFRMNWPCGARLISQISFPACLACLPCSPCH